MMEEASAPLSPTSPGPPRSNIVTIDARRATRKRWLAGTAVVLTLAAVVVAIVFGTSDTVSNTPTRPPLPVP